MQVVDGTPTDCVMLAVGALLGEQPDFVSVGHQPRAQHGRGRALLGHGRRRHGGHRPGHPARSRSPTRARTAENLPAWEQPVATALLEQLLKREDFPTDTLFNVNLPAVPPDGSEAACRSQRSAGARYVGLADPRARPDGREYFWIGGGESKWWGGPDVGFPRRTFRLHFGDAAAPRPDELQAAGGNRRVGI